jgi:hypothetical protein
MGGQPVPIQIRQLDGLRGVQLHGQNHPLFSATLQSGRDTSGDSLLPYSVVIDNPTDFAIIAYAVEWRGVDASGKRIQHVLEYCDHRKLRAIPAHSRALLSMVAGLNVPGVKLSSKSVNHYLDIYSNAKSLEVSVDSLLFEDGSIAGPNANQWMAFAIGSLRAERDVSNAVANLPATASLESLLQPWIQQAYAVVGPGYTDLPGLYRWARHASSADDVYIAMRGHYAIELSNRSRQVGEAPTIDAVKRTRATKVYPQFQ